MNALYWEAALAGILFGTYPLFINRSGLNGNVAAGFYCLMCLVVILPLALRSIDNAELAKANWVMAITASIIGAIGTLALNDFLFKTKRSPEKAASLYLIMLMIQISVPAFYKCIITRQVSLAKIIGFLAAILAAFLLR
ncbi:MAG: hypothetical protein PHT40_01880 [Patescibacteria group bacterium]|nr:hypothetical protein [Patescibacteria group bacterium]